MGEQMFNGNLIHARIVRGLPIIGSGYGVWAEDFVRQADMALFDERKYRDRSNRFGHAGDTKQILRGNSLLISLIGPTQRLLINDRTAIPDCNRKCRHSIFLHERISQVRHRRAFGRGRLGSAIGRLHLGQNRMRKNGQKASAARSLHELTAWKSHPFPSRLAYLCPAPPAISLNRTLPRAAPNSLSSTI